MGNEESREALCASCIHREVCSLKETYLEAQEAVYQAHINQYEPANDQGSARNRMIPVKNFCDWLTIPRLICRHYRKQPEKLTRNFDQDDMTTSTYLKG